MGGVYLTELLFYSCFSAERKRDYSNRECGNHAQCNAQTHANTLAVDFTTRAINSNALMYRAVAFVVVHQLFPAQQAADFIAQFLRVVARVDGFHAEAF